MLSRSRHKRHQTPSAAFSRPFANASAVRLPRGLGFEGDRVRLRRAGEAVLVEPTFTSVSEWFVALDRFASAPFVPEGRRQPSMPERTTGC
ncbi:MAG: hypothetical protein A3G76_12455 [Acidobacteria bacterium RIFCSPLOWO2_12_FULL_65_11]|nr:MAG: hypothetical protein A3H95_13025 [Acidobacteria bacterium RIFCSPLOWO2_02_FULL_64_15]OFW33059.1 MAG: hypothetical protein A3G76_12455 [Acidobacteria bacterium RIFCSPLOWO2_12_FULL_65_11]